MIEAGQIELRRDGERHTLHRGSSKTIPLSIEPDAVYPDMWRVKKPDGLLTDMVNLTRAKDAGVAMALRYLNDPRKRTQEGPPMRTIKNSNPGLGPTEINAPAEAAE